MDADALMDKVAGQSFPPSWLLLPRVTPLLRGSPPPASPPTCCDRLPDEFSLPPELDNLCCLRYLSVASWSNFIMLPESEPGDSSSSRSGWIFRSIWPLKGGVEDFVLLRSSSESSRTSFFWFGLLLPALQHMGVSSSSLSITTNCCCCCFLRVLSASFSDCFFSRRIINVRKRRFTVKHTLQVQVCLCFGPFPLGGWMQTMHEHPGLCRGCFVVAWADAGSDSPSPKIARFASVSSPSRASMLSGSCLAAFIFLEVTAQAEHKKTMISTCMM